MPATATYSLSGNPYVDSLLGNAKWAVSELTFSFPASASYYGSGYGSGEPSNNFGVLNATQQAAARAAFDLYASVSNLTFTEITESSTQHAALRLASSDAPSTAWAYYPTTAAEGGDSWFNKSNGYYDSPAKGNYAYTTFLHEIGHALGLEHAHEGNVMPTARDSMEYTVMSYRSYVGASTTTGYTNESWGYAQSLMMYDIAALQHMYGANYGTNGGNTTYSWSPTTGEMFVNGAGQGAPGGNRVFLTVWDGGGTDTYDLSGYTSDLNIDLRPGEWSKTSSAQLARLHYDGSRIAAGNIANALLHNNDPRSLIENAKGGAGSDTITGNTGANTLWGNGGKDFLNGHAGNDIMYGGQGDDIYIVAASGDRTIELSGGGTDTVRSYISWALADNVERLELLGTGHLNGTGNTLDNTIVGNSKNNLLNGGAGNDYMVGGAGNDIYIVAATGDRTVETAHGGTDTIRSYISWVLADNVERLELQGSSNLSGTGNGLSNTLVGNSGANILDGAAGNDYIVGGGGNDILVGCLGRDLMIGGAGDDTFLFREIADSRPGASYRDKVRDFVPGEDRIDLRAIDANVSASGDQAFNFIGDSAFTGAAGELGFADGVLAGDVDGDRIADFQVHIENVLVLNQWDLLL